MAPGTMVAYALEIGQCDPISMTDGRWSSHRDDLIIIDDICDTGRTFLDPAPQLFPMPSMRRSMPSRKGSAFVITTVNWSNKTIRVITPGPQ